MLKLFLLLYKFQVVVLVLVVDTKFPSLCDRFNIGMHITHSLIKTKNIEQLFFSYEFKRIYAKERTYVWVVHERRLLHRGRGL